VQTLIREGGAEFSRQLVKTAGLSQTLVVEWVSPLERDRYREYRDRDFLVATGKEECYTRLKKFWPARGPVWDALGVLRNANGEHSGLILIEAKSHPAECHGSTCKASEVSWRKIEASLLLAKNWTGAAHDSCWMTDVYQYGNRVAHLYFLREVMHIPTWLVYLYFVDDPHRPTSERIWQQTCAEIKQRLGLSKAVPGLCEIILPAPDSYVRSASVGMR
jgi:hypothetical protein